MSTSSHYHRTLFEKSPNAIAYHRLLRNDTGAVCDSLLLHVNPALEVLFQRAASELVGRRFLEVYPHYSERTQRFISSLDEASRSQTEITLNFHAHFIGKWLRTALFALDADTVASISTDITQEVMQEIEFKGFLQSNLDMLAVGDKNGRFIRVNQEFENILGYSTDELEGKLVTDFIHPDDLEATLAALSTLKEEIPLNQFINRYRCKTGEYKYLEWRAHPIGKYIYASARDTSERRRLEKELREVNAKLSEQTALLTTQNHSLQLQATTDELTGLYNRYFLDQVLDELLDRADRYNETISLVIFDLDRFKKVNDTWGHPVGDEVLKYTTKLAKKHLRRADILIRLGGEEFALLMPQTNLNDAIQAAEKLRQALETAPHPTAGCTTASFGVAERLRAESFKRWYKRADQAMYIAKESGRNRVMPSSIEDAHSLTNIDLHWQPAWNSGSREIDSQHHKLLELATLLLNQRGSLQTEKNLEELTAHIDFHFSAEARLLAKLHYEGAAEHAQHHQKLLAKFDQLIQTYHDGAIRTSAFFSFIIDDLIMDHMLKEDVKFFSFLRQKLAESDSHSPS